MFHFDCNSQIDIFSIQNFKKLSSFNFFFYKLPLEAEKHKTLIIPFKKTIISIFIFKNNKMYFFISEFDRTNKKKKKL